MRTSEEVYHQIRWDPRLDPARFVVGVQQRGARPKRVALPAFTPGGEVPWHRVLFVEADGEVVWDRATGLDRVGESGAGRVRAPRRLRAPLFTASTPHSWVHGWVPTREAAPAVPLDTVTVLTWNVLWDRYDSDRIDTARRRPLLFGELAAADADVIALQEVEPDLLAALLAQPWVRAGYTVDVDPTGPDVDRTGLVVLSRLPVVEAARLPLGSHKAVSAVVVETGHGPLVIAATHLTSDHTANGPAKRRAQLVRVAEALAGVEGDVALVGDFNDGGRRPAAALGMRDAWLEARDDEPPTFDPAVNPLAAVSSLTGRRSRLDRVFVRGQVRCAGAELVGDRPVNGLFASDHYGVPARLAPAVPAATPSPLDHRGPLDSPGPAIRSGNFSADHFVAGKEGGGGAAPELGSPPTPPTPRTAVVWLPGPWEEVERVRREHDHRADRWPPHVTLLFGFVPESDFDRAVPLLAEAVTEVPPFLVRVAGVREFGPDVVWLDPAAAGSAPWTALHDAVRRPFPACRTRRDFTPHLTVGSSRQAAERIGARSDRVDEVVVLSRRGAVAAWCCRGVVLSRRGAVAARCCRGAVLSRRGAVAARCCRGAVPARCSPARRSRSAPARSGGSRNPRHLPDRRWTRWPAASPERCRTRWTWCTSSGRGGWAARCPTRTWTWSWRAIRPRSLNGWPPRCPGWPAGRWSVPGRRGSGWPWPGSGSTSRWPVTTGWR
ncbi:endonuclease/exonuclease/phosphatase family metal-dependent hydrolase [Saccharothrix carnea]|uniref:Endonuclease/exonuclease/phosphatase family metal-dependent hydrolase n=1 Tax=Saccharothrix carnea TaxID=1280637 RepID=A0A2P8I081_SACCR|nr:RNA repair domain-containing protein [Saccharothrix carnea]PSL51878.1 endonuclease/exonuclease/phosphatase family metal-dependent hydrolase [Saccharothrix carnea]